jgi:hypothetical protein
MNTTDVMAYSINQLDQYLMSEANASGTSFPARALEAIASLPDDVADELEALLDLHTLLSEGGATDPALVGRFCFTCGSIHQQLLAMQQVQLELESAIIGPDSVTATRLQPEQIDHLSRFIDTRDRIFRKFADTTLKLLLAGLGLMLVGLLLGII